MIVTQIALSLNRQNAFEVDFLAQRAYFEYIMSTLIRTQFRVLLNKEVGYESKTSSTSAKEGKIKNWRGGKGQSRNSKKRERAQKINR